MSGIAGRARAIRQGEKGSNRKVTGGEVLSDGSQLELVRDPSDPARPALLHWDGERAIIAREIATDGCRYVPPEIDPGVWRHVRLPSGVTQYHSTTELFNEFAI